jgi:hypothetical protein
MSNLSRLIDRALMWMALSALLACLLMSAYQWEAFL